MEEWEQDEGEAGDVSVGVENWAGDATRGDEGIGGESRCRTPEGDAPQSEGVEIAECLSSQEIGISKSGEIRTNTDDSVSESVSREGDLSTRVEQTGEVPSTIVDPTEGEMSTGIDRTEQVLSTHIIPTEEIDPTEGVMSTTGIAPTDEAISTCIDPTEQALHTDITPTEDAPINDSPSEVTATTLDETLNMTDNDDSGRTVLMSDCTSSITDRITGPVTNDCDVPDADTTPQSDEAAGDGTASMNDIFERLGFSSMSMEVFQELRQTFGNEECEYCGRLFYSKSDHEAHIRTHTGECLVHLI